MGALVSLLLAGTAGLLAIPVFMFFFEILAAVTLPQREFVLPRNGVRGRVAVVVPAHNESSGLLGTLDDIRAQLRSGDRLLVVADNCTDDTAAVAKGVGVEVTERHDPSKIGKGYALDWGIRHLCVDPPAMVVIIDADCRLANDALDRLANACAATRRPVQALYLMTAPDSSPINFHVAMFAFRVKNWVRPLGLRSLGLPCQLMGTGMAFPWELISSANLATGEVVEDLRLGLDLARTGSPPLFCPSAGVSSQFPTTVKGAESQRNRWEQGHMSLIATTIPRLVCESISKQNLGLLVLAFDLAVPPLTLLGILVIIMLAISGIGFLFGLSSYALIMSAVNFSVFSLALVLCWLKFGRDILPVGQIVSIASYAAKKLPLYRQILSRSGNLPWTRTDRTKIGDDAD